MWRGWLHALSLLILGPLCAWLVLHAGAPLRLGVLVYALTLLLVLIVSSSYHILARSARVQAVMRRLDHAMIFVLIAGTYTPVILMTLTPPASILVLTLIWAGALSGLVLRSLGLLPRSMAVMYVALGWVAVLCAPAIASRSLLVLTLIALGGVAYTLGAVFFAMHKPVLKPSYFGFHEVFHSFTLAGFSLHFAAVTILVLGVQAA